jgi:6-phosphogluconolactonase
MSTQPLVFVGTYTNTGSEGIYVYRLGARDMLEPLGAFGGPPNPSFLATHPTRPFLYSVSEEEEGAVAAWSVNPATGAMTLLNTQRSYGMHPCHVSVDKTGSFAFAANYSSGTVAMFPIKPDGSLAPASDVRQHGGASVNPERQKSPNAHQALVDPTNRFVYVCDLGTDSVMIYGIDAAEGKLVPRGRVRTQPGAGPRHMAFHPSGRYAFVINELDNTLNAYAVEQGGGLRELQSVSTLPDGYTSTSYCADVHVSSDGRFVYGTNRGHDSIAAFAFTNGVLTALGQTSTGGNWPRNFCLLPSGTTMLIGDQESDTVDSLRVDPVNGRLSKGGVVLRIRRPICIITARW